MGWGIGEHDGLKQISHGGGQARVSTELYMLPDRGFAVALMCNPEEGHMTDLARSIADIVLQLPSPK